MLLLRLEQITPLFNAISKLTKIYHNADVRISPVKLSIITMNNSPRFFATLQILPESFVDYSVDRNHSWGMFIPSFRSALSDARIYPFMKIHLDENTSHIILTFETPSYVPQKIRRMRFFYPEGGDVGQVDEGKFFLIASRDFRRVVRELYFFYDGSINVTLTHSQVRFYIVTRDIIFTKESGQCVIVGCEGEVETQFQIALRPTSFFLSLSFQTDWVWFLKTIDSRSSVIRIPASGLCAQYLIYFPEI